MMLKHDILADKILRTKMDVLLLPHHRYQSLQDLLPQALIKLGIDGLNYYGFACSDSKRASTVVSLLH
jgi:hypothetical protein